MHKRRYELLPQCIAFNRIFCTGGHDSDETLPEMQELGLVLLFNPYPTSCFSFETDTFKNGGSPRI